MRLFSPLTKGRCKVLAHAEGRNSILEITGDTTLPAIALRSCSASTTWFPFTPSAAGMEPREPFRVADVQFDEADRYNQKIQPPDPDTWAKQMCKLRVVTQLFYDMDANLTNVLITKDWKIWRIDFSRGFRLQHDLKDPKDLVQCDRQVLSKLRQLSYDQVFDATKPYLSKDEVKALIARREKMVAYFDNLIAQKGESQVLY